MTESTTNGEHLALWGGRFKSGPSPELARLSKSTQFDWRLADDDIAGSRAHARALGRAGLLTADELQRMEDALDTLQQRGSLFVGPGEECYEGMIVGESAKEGDMVVNVAKAKQLGNQRSSGADKAIQLTPPIEFTLEEALEYIEDDELVEITPQNIRLRKRTLSSVQRKKEQKNK